MAAAPVATTTPTGLRVDALTDADQAFLDSVTRARRRSALWGPFGLLYRCRRTFRRLWRRTIATLLLALVIVGVGISGMQPAAAIDPPNPANLTCPRGPFAPERADQGLMALIGSFATGQQGKLSGTPPTDEIAQAAVKAAADAPKGSIWAQYGSAGTYWTTYGLDCTDLENKILNVVANQVFQLAKTMSVLTIGIFQLTFTGDILSYFLDSNGASPSLVDQVIAQTHATVYSALSAVAILIAAIVMLWRFLFGRLPASTFWGKFIQMALIAGLAAFISAGTNFTGMLNWLNDQTVTISSTMMSAFSSADCISGPPATGRATEATEKEAEALRKKAVICAADSLYRATVYSPWVIGELGSYDDGVGQRILHQQAYSYTDIVNNKGKNNLYARDGGKGTNLSSYDDKHADRKAMVGTWGVSALEQLNATNYSDITAANQPGYWQYYSGGQSGGRFLLALLALFACLMVGIIILAISVSYLLLEISSIMFAMLALPAALFGLIPGFGMRVFLRWVELLLGSFAKRIVLGLFAGLVIGLYQALLNVNAVPWVIKILFITLVAGFGLLYRKRFAEAFTFNFSGTRSFYEHGEASNRLLGSYLGQVERFAQKGDQAEAAAKAAAGMGAGGAAGVAAAGAESGGGGDGGSQIGDKIRRAGTFLPGLLGAGDDTTRKGGGEVPVPGTGGVYAPSNTTIQSSSRTTVEGGGGDADLSSLDRLAAKANQAANAFDSAAGRARTAPNVSGRGLNVVYVPAPHESAGAPARSAAPTQGVPVRGRQ
ncbi:hypothetical protein [Fodinicola acaciae]|uniref:hypothetical protein n=1 Tax=Fodinicola acaciae TaxID=2681555 RepID=UPI0013D8B788|nr:hypothetical protein [Fodinicola acaciae]